VAIAVEDDDLLAQERLNGGPILVIPRVEDPLPAKRLAIEYNVQVLCDDLRQAERLWTLRPWPETIVKK
jgi:hypothetical protein